MMLVFLDPNEPLCDHKFQNIPRRNASCLQTIFVKNYAWAGNQSSAHERAFGGHVGSSLTRSSCLAEKSATLSHKTRMHSSRMRTVHCSSRFGEEGCPCQGVSACGICLGGVCWGGDRPGVCPSECRDNPPVNRSLVKNVTLPQLRCGR